MTLQTSGAISLNDLATEFGGNTPHAINEYYRGGGLVPDTATNAGIPTSGQVDLNDFYGGDVTSTPSGAPQSGSLWSWGAASNKFGGHGFYGRGGDSFRSTRTTSPIQTLIADSNWVGSSSGNEGEGFCSARTDGKLWAWSGDAVPTASAYAVARSNSSPVAIHGGSTSWITTDIYPPGGVGYGAKSDGRLWSWGYDGPGVGAMGRNQVSVVTSTSPAQTVAGGTDWTTARHFRGSVSSGGGATFLWGKTDGKLWAVGKNRQGECADGTVNNVGSPKPIGTTTDWTAAFSTTGIKSDGRLWVWASNVSGVLGRNQAPTNGNNPTVNYSSPVQTVATATNWVAAGGMGITKVASRSDGRLWGWGANFAYHNGTGIPRSSPTQISGSYTDWDSYEIGLGGAIKTDGKFWIWGPNNEQEMSVTGQTAPAGGCCPMVVGTDTNWVHYVGVTNTRRGLKS